MRQKSCTKSSLSVWRNYMGLTQRDLANLAKVSQGHISDAENLRASLSVKLRTCLEASGRGALATIEKHEKEVRERQESIRRELQAVKDPATANMDEACGK